MMNNAVTGTGYMGLSNAALPGLNHKTYAVDINNGFAGLCMPADYDKSLQSVKKKCIQETFISETDVRG